LKARYEVCFYIAFIWLISTEFWFNEIVQNYGWFLIGIFGLNLPEINLNRISLHLYQDPKPMPDSRKYGEKESRKKLEKAGDKLT